MAKRVPGWAWRICDAVWLVALALYALAGYRNVPFHGDESTIIAMSRDYHYLFQAGDLDAVLYTGTPDDPAAQHLRLVNGSVSKLAIGLAWDLAGFSVDDLNQQWEWGAPWEWNVIDGHMPRDSLLYAARLSSALMLAASVWVLFAVAWIAGGGRAAAYTASLVYIVTPVVRVNGQRAMFEGALLLSTALVLLAGLILLRARVRGRARWWHYAALGLAAGLAISSKHTTVIAVGIVFGGLIVRLRARPTLDVHMPHVLRLAGAGVLAGVVFLLLNPVWWSDPLGMPRRIWNERQTLMRGQRAGYGTYDGFDDHLAGLIRCTVDGAPQYYEASGWGARLRDSIAAYEAHTWTGIKGGVIGAVLRMVGLVVGTAVLLDRAAAPARDPTAGLVLAWFWGTALVLLALTPFDWQRYYLPLQPALAVVIGAGVAGIAGRVIGRGGAVNVTSDAH